MRRLLALSVGLKMYRRIWEADGGTGCAVVAVAPHTARMHRLLKLPHLPPFHSRIIWLSHAAGAASSSNDRHTSDTAQQQQQQQQHGYTVAFPAISMHAVATDAESFNKPCLYLQLDTGEQDEDDGEEEEEAVATVAELRLIPADPGTREAGGRRTISAAPACYTVRQRSYRPCGPSASRHALHTPAVVDSLFKAFCEGAERNPDPGASDDEEARQPCCCSPRHCCHELPCACTARLP